MITKMKWPAPEDPLEVQRQLWADWHGDIGFDIGANVGQTMQRMLAAFSRVYAFEPNPDPYQVLLELYATEERADLNCVAVSDVDGEIHLAAMPPQMEYGMLITPETHGLKWSAQTLWDNTPHLVVPSWTVDHLARDIGVPDFCKVDTEGHEGHILKGATHVLSLGRTDWMIEFHNPPLHEFCLETLQKYDYEVETVRHPHYPKGTQMWHTHGWVRAKAPHGRNASA
jgi:FkbM family methyltransferase